MVISTCPRIILEDWQFFLHPRIVEYIDTVADLPSIAESKDLVPHLLDDTLELEYQLPPTFILSTVAEEDPYLWISIVELYTESSDPLYPHAVSVLPYQWYGYPPVCIVPG